MPSVLNSGSQIVLIGVLVDDDDLKLGTKWTGPHSKLGLISLTHYQNETLELARPTIFTVPNDGFAIPSQQNPENKYGLPINVDFDNELGIDAKYWVIDRKDMLLRLDASSGSASDVLLDREFGAIATESMHSRGAEPARARRRWRSMDED